MVNDPFKLQNPAQEALADFSRLRRFPGTPAEFWPAFLAAAGALIGAARAALILRDPKQPESWKKLGDWASNGHADRSVMTFTRQLTEIGERSLTQGSVILPL